jgi:prophage maintenance system killer protein
MKKKDLMQFLDNCIKDSENMVSFYDNDTVLSKLTKSNMAYYYTGLKTAYNIVKAYISG